ncbi:MAG: helix-turn-helix domain-containing protein, partial [Bacteroidetes bacterium]|nr:helix-turn-helix domain-containing protein [Bacteroidota bacterium]
MLILFCMVIRGKLAILQEIGEQAHMKSILTSFLMIIVMILCKEVSGQEKVHDLLTYRYDQMLKVYRFERDKFIPRREYLENLNTDSTRAVIEDLKKLVDSSYKAGLRKLRLSAFFETGFLYFLLDENDSAISNLNRAIELVDKSLSPWEYAMINALAAESCKRKGYFSLSNEYNLKILSTPEYYADTFRRASTLGFLAENYQSLLEFEKSMECCKESFSLFSAIRNYSHASYQLVILAGVSKQMNPDSSFLEYLRMAVALSKKTDDSARIANNLVNLGKGYLSAGEYRKGLKYLLIGWKIDRQVFPHRDIYASREISHAYLMLDSLEKAEYFARRALGLSRKINADNWLFLSSSSLANVFSRSGKLDSARYYLEQAIMLAKSTGRKVSSPGLYNIISDVCLKMGDYEAAAFYLDTAYHHYRMVINMNNQDELSKMRAEFDYDLQKAKINELKIWNSLEREKNRRYVVIIITVLLVLLLSIGFIWGIRIQYARLKSSYFSLVRKNIELDKLSGRLRILEKEQKVHEPVRNEDRILDQVKDLLDNQRIYQDPEISLIKLADRVGTNTSYLSSIINTHYHVNFKTLINKYRIDEARAQLVSGKFDNYSIDGIAREVGYRSRSNFFQMFKQITGVTPAVYVQNYQQALGNT